MNISEEKMNDLMRLVMSEVNIAINEGNSPFAAFLLDKEGNIKYKAHNTTNIDCDPTAHAEVQAIRKACKILDRRHLNDCILISTSKCCPMCLSAAIWARIPVIYYSLDYAKASSSGFKDNDIADYIKGNNKLIREIRVDNNNCNKLFEIWKNKEDKEVY